MEAGDAWADGALSIDEAVIWSGIRRTRIYKAIADGRLASTKQGWRRLVSRASLRQLLASAEAPAATATPALGA